jgi:hypothetical protein
MIFGLRLCWRGSGLRPAFVRALHVTEPLIFEPFCGLSLWGVPYCENCPVALSLPTRLCSIPYSVRCIPFNLRLIGNWGCFRGRVMYNVDLVRNLCKTITREKDARKSAELLALLRAVMREDQEEIRVQTAFLAKNYSLIGSESQAAD